MVFFGVSLNAAPLGEVGSAVCAEAGGVRLSFIRILKNPSVGCADSSPAREPIRFLLISLASIR